MAAGERRTGLSIGPNASAPGSSATAGSVLAAALALPGLMPTVVQAELAPEQAEFAFRYLSYEDRQPGFDRIDVQAPSIRVVVPFAEQFAVEAGAVFDSVSGASPRYYSTVSGASHMDDKRYAQDARLTWYRPRSAFSIGYTHSDEHDYLSNAASLDARFSSDDQNTTFNIGIGGSHDRIDPVNNIVDGETRDTWQAIAGITQALSRVDLAQIEIGYSDGSGYFDDPYKLYDSRPHDRRQTTALLRWNHFVEAADASLRLSYRYYDDSWKVHAHTLSAEWVQRMTPSLTLTPGLRYHMQTSASFYVDPVFDDNGDAIPPAIPDGIHSTLDQRLAAWGAVSGSFKLEWAFAPGWRADGRFELYRQKSGWRIDGDGSPGLARFDATWIEIGLVRRF